MKRRLEGVIDLTDDEPLCKRTRLQTRNRAFIDLTDSVRHRRPLEGKINEWVSGTDIRNFLSKDHLVDWLKLTKPRMDGRNDFFNFIMQRGKDFEQELVDYIRETITPVTTVSTFITSEACRETVRLMKLGVPIIHSAPFKIEETKTQGVIDFLVRSDFLSSLVKDNPLPEEFRTLHAPHLNGDYHYVVIDAKFSTLPLRADGIHLLNSGHYPAYKGQLRIYTEAIGAIQGYTSKYAYILGRRWSYTQKDEKFFGLNCLERLGVIDYLGVDKEYVEKTKNAIDWVRDVRRDGRNWSVNPPSRLELYPNMCVDSGEWNGEKNEIANQIGDITQIWYCGIKHRENALKNDITSWRDPRCNSQTIGMNGVRANTVDKIIDINRQEVDKIRPRKIKTNVLNWRQKTSEMFVDFETFCDIFASFGELPEQPHTDKIFMIGVYYLDGVWQYKNFVAKEATNEEEFRIMDEFVQFIHGQNRTTKLWHWHADEHIWTKAENHQMDLACEEGNIERADHIVDNWRLHTWSDLCKVFREEPIVLKDCFKFGLKEIAGAMHKHGLITTKLDSECKSGMDAAIRAWNVYETSDNPSEEQDIVDIGKYNQFDVQVLQEMLEYLRINC